MNNNIDLSLSKLTVRLKTTSRIVGTGLLYYEDSLIDKVYVFTAAHNLFEDGDSFKQPIKSIIIDFYNASTDSYNSLSLSVNHKLVRKDIDQDLAVLVVDKAEAESKVGSLISVHAIRERISGQSFALKGFPNATDGQELVCIYPTWLQELTGVNKFQLSLTEDYTDWSIGGFSGSGVFLLANESLYLLGIFTRFRKEEKGKVIYCQYVETLNDILRENYLSPISFSFFGDLGLTDTFFKTQVENAIKNLGPRFNEKLNFRLPIARMFNDLAKDSIFKTRLLRVFDNWLLARTYFSGGKGSELLQEIESDLSSLKKSTVQWLSTINWSANQEIDIGEFIKSLDKLKEKIDSKRDELYHLQAEELKKEENKNKDRYHTLPYDGPLNILYTLQKHNYHFESSLDKINVHVANHPYLVIHGEAGCGKSHLLGDIASDRNKKNIPTILLLGQLFRNGQNVWQNIISQLGLSCTKTELLSALNSIGQQVGSRVLLLIDALNEGYGKEIWPAEMAGFINDFSNFPFVGLAVTVRSTYFKIIIPKVIIDNKDVTKVLHEGFKGNEYAALKLFCEHHGLEQPNFPILAPEFTNPLFLQLICEGVKSSGSKKFPRGFQSVGTIFNLYLGVIYKKLSDKREEYSLRQHVIKDAIYSVAREIFQQKHSRALSVKQALKLFDDKYPTFKNLLHDLILESVFIQSVTHDYNTGADIDIIYFSYERLGDFYIAQELLSPYTNSKEVMEAFKEGSVLGGLANNAAWRNRGILEAFSILLPEKYKLEIVEVFNWIFAKDQTHEIQHVRDSLNYNLLESLKWREPKSINDAKLTKWFRSNKFYVDESNWFNTLVELTTQLNHPFNSDRFHVILGGRNMAKRDPFWQSYLRYYSTEDDSGNAFPIKRLLDWAWQPRISSMVDSETARLAGQTLAWVLATTKRSLRDQATKAVVNLLEEQPDALLKILKAFKDVDDLYIIERLYAIAYGCALRTSKPESLRKIAQYVFDSIFKGGRPTVHILVRDFARCTVEYSLYMKLPIKGDISLIKPPYGSKMPKVIPSNEQIEAYKLDYKAEDYKANYGYYKNAIVGSVMGGDFGRYTISSALRDFNTVSFTQEAEFDAVFRKLNKEQKRMIKLIQTYTGFKYQYENDKENLETSMGLEKYTEVASSIEKALLKIPKLLRADLTKENYKFFADSGLNFIRAVERSKNRQLNFFDIEPIKRWIVKRVFDLGYQATLHGPYESSIQSYNNRSDNKIERIGKKYQWIAFHEAVAMVADNYKIKSEGWSSETRYEIFEGAWRNYLRNIDPAFVTKSTELDDADADYDEPPIREWWTESSYDFWNIPDAEWASSIEDLPNPKKEIMRRDAGGVDWVYLNTNIHWREPKPIGREKYGSGQKEIWYMIQAYLVRKTDKEKIVKYLRKKNFWGRWLPESHKANMSLLNRENYWSPASSRNESERWQELDGSEFKVMVTTSEAVGEMSNDTSGAHFPYDMPCKALFKGMKLKYSSVDGEFLNDNDEIVVINPENKGMLMRKEDLLLFLKKKNLDVVWTILGEKNAINGAMYASDVVFKVINGVFSFEKEKISGKLKLNNRDDGR